MTIVRIPNTSKKRAEGVSFVIDRTVRETGFDDFNVALTMSHIFESTVLCVTMGGTVLFPGFGLFGAKLGRDNRCRPAFIASRGFYNEVLQGAPPSRVGNEELLKFQKNHQRIDKSHRAFLAQQQFRASIKAQMSCLGRE